MPPVCAVLAGVASYSRSDHAHGAILSDTATLASAAQTGGVATDYSRSDHAHGFANPNLLYNSTGEKGPNAISNSIDGWNIPTGGNWSTLLVDKNNLGLYEGSPAILFDSGNSDAPATIFGNQITWAPNIECTFSGFVTTSGTGITNSSIGIEFYTGTSWVSGGSADAPAGAENVFLTGSVVAPAGTSAIRMYITSGSGRSRIFQPLD